MGDLDRLLAEADRRPLVGWDLSCDGRIATAAPWDFEAACDEYIRRSPNLLDLGTGGGEWLSGRPFRPGHAVATEAWPPNIPIARARLGPLGVEVVAVDDVPDNADQQEDDGSAPAHLPFADASFHLVTNRHESFVASEVARVLAPGGWFVTQQVASGFDAEIRELVGAPARPEGPAWTLGRAVDQVERAGLIVDRRGEGAATMSFADVGALAWYLKSVPFVLPGFAIPDYRARLEQLHRRIEASGPLEVRDALFWLAARK